VIFLNEFNSKSFRELIRVLERKLGLLNKQDSCCSQVSLAQCHALVEIGRAESISLKELANILSLDISTMSRTVDSLVKKDFVLRSPSKLDRRSIDIELTEKGLITFKDIEIQMDEKFNRILETISAENQLTAITGLNIIIEALSVENFNCSDDKVN
jgi:DNA-binding MarR family transcriptional regulator